MKRYITPSCTLLRLSSEPLLALSISDDGQHGSITVDEGQEGIEVLTRERSYDESSATW